MLVFSNYEYSYNNPFRVRLLYSILKSIHEEFNVCIVNKKYFEIYNKFIA